MSCWRVHDASDRNGSEQSSKKIRELGRRDVIVRLSKDATISAAIRAGTSHKRHDCIFWRDFRSTTKTAPPVKQCLSKMI